MGYELEWKLTLRALPVAYDLRDIPLETQFVYNSGQLQAEFTNGNFTKARHLG